jgi:hypothetical protein
MGWKVLGVREVYLQVCKMLCVFWDFGSLNSYYASGRCSHFDELF